MQDCVFNPAFSVLQAKRFVPMCQLARPAVWHFLPALKLCAPWSQRFAPIVGAVPRTGSAWRDVPRFVCGTLPVVSPPGAREESVHQAFAGHNLIAIVFKEQATLFFVAGKAVFLDEDTSFKIAVNQFVHGRDLLHLMYLL